jgi:imidazolonepropionase-like amidohydrolase
MHLPPFVCALAFGLTMPQPWEAVNERTLVLRNVTIIDGTGTPPLPNRTIVIKAGRILEVAGSPDRAPAPGPDTEHLDLTGHYAIPGLVDTHVHLSIGTGDPAAALRTAFYGGVTAVRDMGGDGAMVKRLAERARRSDVAEPRVYFAVAVRGSVAVGQSLAGTYATRHRPALPLWLQDVVEETSDVESIVARAKSSGATGIKLYSDLRSDLLRALSAHAKRVGLRVWGHARIFPHRPSEVLEAGIEVLSHASQLAFEEMNGPDNGDVYRLARPDSAAAAALLRSMRERGAILEPTLSASFAISRTGRRERSRVDNVPSLAWSVAVTRRAHQLGVMLAAGTDLLSGGPGRLPHIHRELELLVSQGGLSPLDAIRAATWTAARVLGNDGEFGTIAEGKWADLAILRADPSRDIRNTRTVAMVIKAGVVHNAAQHERYWTAGQRPSADSSSRRILHQGERFHPRATLPLRFERQPRQPIDLLSARYLRCVVRELREHGVQRDCLGHEHCL